MKRFFLLFVFVALLVTPFGSMAQGDDDSFYVSDDGAFAVFLPEGWVAEGEPEGEISLASSPEALAIIQESEDIPVLEAGEAGIELSAIPLDFLVFLELDESASQTEIMDAVILTLAAEEEDFPELSPVEEIEVGNRPAAMTRGAVEGAEFALVVYPLAADTFGLAGIASGDPLDDNLEFLLDALSGVNFSQPLIETGTFGDLEFAYPEGWTVDEELTAPGIIITNDSELLVPDAPTFEGNQFAVILFNLTELGLDLSDAEDQEALIVMLAEDLADEGDEIGEPSSVEIGDRLVTGVSVTNSEEDKNDGGMAIVEAPNGDMLAILYAGPQGQSDLIVWTAVQILLSVE